MAFQYFFIFLDLQAFTVRINWIVSKNEYEECTHRPVNRNIDRIYVQRVISSNLLSKSFTLFPWFSLLTELSILFWWLWLFLYLVDSKPCFDIITKYEKNDFYHFDWMVFAIHFSIELKEWCFFFYNYKRIVWYKRPPDSGIFIILCARRSNRTQKPLHVAQLGQEKYWHKTL